VSDKHGRRETYQLESVCIEVFLDVFRQVPARHPIRNELEGSDGDTQEG